uniref:C2 DOCK-type domain-containing protein n=1 Tax=Angiostrongylus cantonensis TaxID=6313 RepID=A0A0K0D4W8_ANGCA
MSLKCLRQDVLETVPNEADSSSTASFDLGRGPFVWRGPRAVARALQPPVVERKNLFSLYRNLSPLPEPACEPSSMLSADSRNVLSDCPSHSSVQRFLVSFTKLELKLNIAPGLSQQIEPFYVSIFAYDVSCGKRVSEEFHLECSSDIGDNVVEAPKDQAVTSEPYRSCKNWFSCRNIAFLSTDRDSLGQLARVNSSMYALTPLELPGDTAVPPVFELQTFEDVIAEPYSDFVNLLYIYPLSLKYDSQRVFTKARNILCTVRFVRGDSYSTTVFFNRLHPSGPLISSGKCAVQYHQQFPQFSDEIKMKLPVCLRTSDHLLFSFSHISVGGQSHTKCGESVENAVGHAWLPLMWTKDRLVMESDEQEFALPVAADLPKSYFRVRPLQEGNFKEYTKRRNLALLVGASNSSLLEILASEGQPVRSTLE